MRPTTSEWRLKCGETTNEWIKSDWFCPKCGKQEMWQEVGTGDDYYHDCSVTCKACGYSMCCVGVVEDEE